MKKRIVVRKYKSERLFERDAKKWAKRGYSVKDVSVQGRSKGMGQVLALGVGALLTPKKYWVLVTYELER